MSESDVRHLLEAVARLEERLAAMDARLEALVTERTWVLRIVLAAVIAAVLSLVIIPGN